MRRLFFFILWAALPWLAEAAVQVDAVALPVETAAPRAWFTPAEIPALTGRIVNPVYSGFYNSFKGFVDGQLASLATRDDDTLSKVAKAGALLHRLGAVPPHTYPTYAAAAVAALVNIDTRSGANLNILQDCSRLQSMAEAYDMLKGTAELAASDAAARSIIAQWTGQINGSLEMLFHPNDNWSIKAGSSLVTVSLILASHGSAGAWLSKGRTWINGALAVKATDTGWYAESGHYINYSLNNLVSTAHHVKNITGVNWFDNLEPFAAYALYTRMPNGSFAAFEEGVSAVFAFDVLVGEMPALAPQLAWAWNTSARDSSNYENQQIHSVTRFLIIDDTVAPQMPIDAPTRFIGANANTAVLRSSWAANAVEAIMMCAPDYQSGGLDSRHNTQNPLDMTVYALGDVMIPVSSGGPQVTSSANRSYYLNPANKNLPLVNGTAPYITNPGDLSFINPLDSRDANGLTNRFMDVATMTARGYDAGAQVARTLAMLDDRAFVVVDQIAGSSAAVHEQAWHVRGTRQVVTNRIAHQYVQWVRGAVALDLHGVADQALAQDLTAGYYVAQWGSEVPLEGLDLRINSAIRSTFLTFLNPRSSAQMAPIVTPLSASAGAAMRIREAVSGAQLWVLGGDSGSVRNAGAVHTDARVGLIKERAGALLSLGMVEGRVLGWSGTNFVTASAVVTMSVQAQTNGILAELSSAISGSVNYTITRLPQLDPNVVYEARFNGAPLRGAMFSEVGGTWVLTGLTGGGALEITARASCGSGTPPVWTHAPAWWVTRNVLRTSPADDYALVNQGQVKHLARQAVMEMEATLPCGAGPVLTALTDGFATNDNYAAVTLGQLKNLAQPFYDRLAEAGYTGGVPWTVDTADDDDYEPATIGQVKSVFSFDF